MARYSGCSRDTTGDQVPDRGAQMCTRQVKLPPGKALPLLAPGRATPPGAASALGGGSNSWTPSSAFFMHFPPLILPLVFMKLVRLGHFSGKGMEGNQCRGEEHKLWSQSVWVLVLALSWVTLGK